MSRRIGELLLAILRKTRKCQELQSKDLVSEAGFSSEIVTGEVKRLATNGFLTLKDSLIEVSVHDRLSLAVEAVVNGVDLELVCRVLGSREFEDMAAEVFRANCFTTHTRFVFSHSKKRQEIDVIAKRDSATICADCKHWRRGLSKWQLLQVAMKQVERTEGLVREIGRYGKKLKISSNHSAYFMPMILTLTENRSRLVEGVPIVPVLALRSFLHEFDLHLEELRIISPIFDNKRALLFEETN
jgi:hypothetical protein